MVWAAIASVAAGLFAAQAAVPAVSPGVAIFRDACLSSTPMPRTNLATVAATHGWTRIQAEIPDGQAWRDVYRAGSVMIHLDQHIKSETSDGGRICVVLVGPAPSDWKNQVSRLPLGATVVGAPGVYDPNVYTLPPELELTVWDLPDASRIHALREPDNTLELSVNYPTGN